MFNYEFVAKQEIDIWHIQKLRIQSSEDMQKEKRKMLCNKVAKILGIKKTTKTGVNDV